MKAADLDGLHKSGQLESFDKRTTGGQITNFVRGRRREATGLCAVPVGADDLMGEAMTTVMGYPRAYY
eukprot:16643-Prymnesium_polylepis.1